MKGALLTARDLAGTRRRLRCDVCVVGSGAGGAVLAAGVAAAGRSVVMLEEGGFYTRKDFDLREDHAYRRLYQDVGARTTEDLAITVLQGRSVGGGTTVNWTTCFRTPDRVLEHWARRHRIPGYGPDDLRPHFEAVERRLNIHRWQAPPNANNAVLLRGARKLGWEATILRRNVRGCADSGYCGMGCPVDAKQGMLLTYLPDALRDGMRLLADTRAERIEVRGDRARRVHARVLDRDTGQPTGAEVTVEARVVVVSGGAINSPALLLRSGLDEGGVGRRTFLHPVVAVLGRYTERVDGFYGAPQSVGSHAFFDRGADRVGFFLEAAPLHPMLVATALPLVGEERAQQMRNLPHLSGLIAVCVDGLLEGDEGGTVRLDRHGRIRLRYRVGPPLAEAFHAAHRGLVQVHLAAGAVEVATAHRPPVRLRPGDDLRALDTVPYGAHHHPIFTAHQMGGCRMGLDPATSVVDPDLRHHRVKNLFVVDGSVLPTAAGVNPSETIYAIAHKARAAVIDAAGG